MRIVCLGGWCGPSQAISKMGLRHPHDSFSPFEFVRCSMDAVTEYTNLGRLCNFFPDPADIDPVSIWLLFRSRHSCFAHFDIRKPEVQRIFHKRMEGYQELLKSSADILFVRTAISTDPMHEINEIRRFHEVLCQVRPYAAQSRSVLIIHDQKMQQTGILYHPSSDIMISNLEYNEHKKNESLFSQTEDGYMKILKSALDTPLWQSKYNAPSQWQFRKHKNLSHIEGVPIFTHDCIGYGTTFKVSKKMRVMSASKMNCSACTTGTMHTIRDIYAWDSKKDWTDEESIELMRVKFQIGEYDDKSFDFVEFIEAFCNRYGRSSHETLQKLQSM